MLITNLLGGASVSGFSGYSGIGTSGFTGVSGYSGASGSGISGYSGFSGTGISGFSGISGYSGFSGSGISGYSGFSGSGISGYSGFSGSGISGYSGFSGSGISGYSGFSGSGISGYSGYSGTAGPSTVINASDDTSTTPLYPVMVGAAGSNQTPKVSTTKLSFNASTGALTLGTGNLTFGGTAQRITGEMSTATVANRLYFQTNTTNGSTNVSSIPNGTGPNSGFAAFNNSDPTNASYASIGVIGATEARINSAVTGTGTYLPLTFYTNGSESMRIDTSGNVGIGITSYSNRLTAQVIVDGLSVIGYFRNISNISANTAAAIDLVADQASSRITTLRDGGGSSATLVFSNTSSGVMGERMRIDYSGNVGIGTTSPGDLLQINRASGSGITSGIALTTAAGSAGDGSYIKWTGAGTGEKIARIDGVQEGTDTGSIRFNTGNGSDGFTERMRIDGSGNVGIGTSPSVKLDIAGGSLGTSSGNQIIVENLSVTSSNADSLQISKFRDSAGSDWTTAGWRLQQKIDTTWMGWMQFNGTGNQAGVSFGTGSSTVGPGSITEVMRINSSGNVGIGTTSPGFKLDVSGQIRALETSNVYVLLGGDVAASVSPTTYVSLDYDTGTNRGRIDALSGGVAWRDISINTRGGNTLLVAGGGNVGIGTTNPTYKLDVAGGIQTNAGFQGTFATSGTNVYGLSMTNGTQTAKFMITGPTYNFSNVGANEAWLYNDAGNVTIGPYGAYVTKFITNGSERMRIDTSGRLLVGFTASKTYGGILQASTTIQSIGLADTSITDVSANDYNALDSSPTYASAVLRKFGPSAAGNLYVAGATAAAGWAEICGINLSGVAYGTNSGSPVIFGTSGNERMRIDSLGNVAIGTTAPTTKLTVTSGGTTTQATNKGDIQIIGNPATATGAGGLEFAASSFGSGYGWKLSTIDPGTGVHFIFTTRQNASSWSEMVRISASGGLGVGTTADPGAGAIYATGNITAYYSDDRLKTRLGNIENALEKVQSLTGFYYEANDLAQSMGYKVKREVGVSAQDVEKVLPEIVVPAPINEEYKTIHYEKMMPLLIEAIKELSSEMANIKKHIGL